MIPQAGWAKGQAMPGLAGANINIYAKVGIAG
jgi:hypothetical protein